MKTNAYLGLVLALGLAACGDGGSSKTEDNGTTGAGGATAGGGGGGIAPGTWVDVDANGTPDGQALDVNGDGAVESLDTNGDGKADAALPPGAVAVNGTSGTTGGGGTNQGGTGPSLGQDGGANGGFEDRDATVVSGMPAEVKCGTNTCTIKDNFACCETPSDSGWSAACMGASGCSGTGGPPKNSTAECDDAKDCGGLVEQYCCFVMQGPPESFIGPGTPYGRECRSIADCNDAMGFPQGTSKFSCSTDADCPNKGKCSPEEAGPTTGGGGRTPRPWVKVCK